jgi:hypothetical protein
MTRSGGRCSVQRSAFSVWRLAFGVQRGRVGLKGFAPKGLEDSAQG